MTSIKRDRNNLVFLLFFPQLLIALHASRYLNRGIRSVNLNLYLSEIRLKRPFGLRSFISPTNRVLVLNSVSSNCRFSTNFTNFRHNGEIIAEICTAF